MTFNSRSLTHFILEDGGYSDWIFGECTATCGMSQRIRYRRCNNPSPKHGGADCEGSYLETLSCMTKECPSELM